MARWPRNARALRRARVARARLTRAPTSSFPARADGARPQTESASGAPLSVQDWVRLIHLLDTGIRMLFIGCNQTNEIKK